MTRERFRIRADAAMNLKNVTKRNASLKIGDLSLEMRGEGPVVLS